MTYPSHPIFTGIGLFLSGLLLVSINGCMNDGNTGILNEEVVWHYQFGTAEDDAAFTAAHDSSDNLYIGGSTAGSLDGNLFQGHSDSFITKFSATGEKLWTRQFSDYNSQDIVVSIAVDNEDNLILTGVTFPAITGGVQNVFVKKINLQGHEIWSRYIQSSEIDSASGVATDDQNNIYVVGHTFGELDGNTNRGRSDIFLAKFNAQGNPIWTRVYGNDQSDYGKGVVVDVEGNVYVSGHNITFTHSDGSLTRSESALVIKYDSFGNLLWSRETQSGAYSDIAGLALDADNNILTIGSTTNALGEEANPAAGRFDAYLMKYDSSGNKLWSRLVGNKGNGEATSISVDRTTNTIYVAGRAYGDIWLTQYSALGEEQWYREYRTIRSDFVSGIGSVGYDTVDGMSLDSQGNVFLAGYSKKKLYGFENQGGADVIILKISPELVNSAAMNSQ